MRIDDLDFGEEETKDTEVRPRKIRLRPGQREVIRFSPIVYVANLHYVRSKNSVYRCINYDWEGNKVANNCYLCDKVGSKTYYLFPCLVFNKSKYNYAILIASTILAREIKKLHDTAKICDWKLGRKVVITCTKKGNVTKYKLTKIGTTNMPIGTTTRKRLESIVPDKIFLDAWKKHEEEDETEADLEEVEESLEIDDEIEEGVAEEIQESEEDAELEELLDEESDADEESMIDEESLVDTDDVIDLDETDIDRMDVEKELLESADEIDNLADDDDIEI